MRRRQFALVLTASATAAVAGCLGGGDDSGGDADTSNPTAVVESYYQAADEVGVNASADEAIDTVSPFFYDGSPLLEFIQQSLEQSDGPQEAQNLDTVEAAVVDEDLGVETLTTERNLEMTDLSEGEIGAIAEENAIVEASLEYTDEQQGQTQQHLTATENGDWLIVF